MLSSLKLTKVLFQLKVARKKSIREKKLKPYATGSNDFDTVEALLTDTLVSGKPYLRPPS